MWEQLAADHLINLLIVVLLAVSSYLYGRLERIEKNIDKTDRRLNEINQDHEQLSRRLRGDPNDETFDGYMADTNQSLEELHEQLDRIEYEMKQSNTDVRRVLDSIIRQIDETDESVSDFDSWQTDDSEGSVFDTFDNDDD